MNQSLSSSNHALAADPGQGPRIAVIAASWHADIVQQAVQAFGQRVVQLLPGSAVSVFEVPGAFEIPLRAKRLAQSGAFDAIVACGLMVDGGIYRHDFVARAVIDGLMRVQLDTLVPVFSVVLTPHHFHAHEDHQRFFAEHFVSKGHEAAQACAAILQTADVGLPQPNAVAVGKVSGPEAQPQGPDAALGSVTTVPGVWTRRGAERSD